MQTRIKITICNYLGENCYFLIDIVSLFLYLCIIYRVTIRNYFSATPLSDATTVRSEQQ